jgi:hypothetical protein
MTSSMMSSMFFGGAPLNVFWRGLCCLLKTSQKVFYDLRGKSGINIEKQPDITQNNPERRVKKESI